MKTSVVTIREVYESCRVIEHEDDATEQEIKTAAAEGGVEVSLEYSRTLDSSSWDVAPWLAPFPTAND